MQCRIWKLSNFGRDSNGARIFKIYIIKMLLSTNFDPSVSTLSTHINLRLPPNRAFEGLKQAIRMVPDAHDQARAERLRSSNCHDDRRNLNKNGVYCIIPIYVDDEVLICNDSKFAERCQDLRLDP